MAVTTKVLVPSRYVVTGAPGGTPETVYQAIGVTTIIDKFTARNLSASSRTVYIYIGDQQPTYTVIDIILTKTLLPGETYIFPEMVGQVLRKNDTIGLHADAGNAISVRVCGREIN